MDIYTRKTKTPTNKSDFEKKNDYNIAKKSQHTEMLN